MRMGIESLMVVAHATGRTLVIPPQDHIYLLDKEFKDPEDQHAHRQMGIRDFYNMQRFKSQKGFHVITMKKFLEREGVTGRRKGKLPPRNSTSLWGSELWSYLSAVADVTPQWFDKVVAFPERPEDFLLQTYSSKSFKKKLKEFRFQYEEWRMTREVVYYGQVCRCNEYISSLFNPSCVQELQNASHLHFPGGGPHRILQHHYGILQ